MKLIIMVTIIAMTGALRISRPKIDKQWEEFKTEFRSNEYKSGSTEEEIRKKIFEQNYRRIVSHNEEADRGLHTYRLGVNQFADMTAEEYRRQTNTLDLSALSGHQNSLNVNKQSVDVSGLPDTVDWRTKGVITPVKNQGGCPSCWAFSSVDTIEAQHAMKTGKLVTLSVQNLVDCPVYRLYNMSTCATGNYMHHAFEYVMANGIDTDQSYPYIDGDNYKCLYDKRTVGATISGYVNITSGDELEMQRAVATVGPVTVGIDATTDGFRFYKSGVYKDTKHECKGQYFDELHHAVTAVGYGTENGVHYWLLRNSYTTKYGDQGYMKMARNNNNQCGVATYALYPTGVN